MPIAEMIEAGGMSKNNTIESLIMDIMIDGNIVTAAEIG